MKTFITLLFTSISILLFSQTKMISYKSHSGNMKNFHASIVNDAFDTNDSNLGGVPDRTVKYAQLDSVIYISPQRSVMVTSKVCEMRSTKEITNWKPGRDTIYNPKLFASKNTDSIKRELKDNYFFQNDMDEVVFVGFQQDFNKKKSHKKRKSNKTNKDVIKGSTSKNNDRKEFPMYLGLFLITGIAGVYSWRKNRK